jgi:hypothetical protein
MRIKRRISGMNKELYGKTSLLAGDGHAHMVTLANLRVFIYFKNQPLDKVGVYAVRENQVLYQNLMASIEGRALQPFDPGGDYLLIFNFVEERKGAFWPQ